MAAACSAVAVCYALDFRYNMDFNLVATGTTFPLVFTIQQDWDQTENFPSSLGNNNLQWARKVKAVLSEFCNSCSRYLTAQDKYESVAERRLVAKKNDELYELFLHRLDVEERNTPHFARRVHHVEREDPGHVHLLDCYRALSLLSVLNEQLTLKAGYTRGGEGGMSRTNQYLRYIISNLEACGILLHIFAIILAPYFAHFCDSWLAIGNDEETCPAGYAGACVYVLIVMLLYHVQVDIEMPFDEKGLDDVFFMQAADLDESMGMHATLSGRSSADLDSIAGSSPRETSRTGGFDVHLSRAPFPHHKTLSAKDLQSNKPLRTIPSDHELNVEDPCLPRRHSLASNGHEGLGGSP
ncbi:hypothetical protein GPECTOR_1g671 [Gonium pectorale]|uniref:Uncharacterized protein n=1 Tax=Gonium pectorale TaxID=33097 RepID=A0A150H3Y2_GONPE|nr:hypothetical protein GPECTOR_1g671 [Gonium pectorale]|eukprot:KXZ56745.1 hypothetical protein GPECTOR_1g671 [Gonium pectorale]